MGPLAKLIGSGIGLTKEAQAHRAKSKSAQPPAHDGADESQEGHSEADIDDHLDEDDAQWELDDYQEEKTGEEDDGETRDIDKIMKTFFDRHPPPPYTVKSGSLPLPVIIPQRRPEAKARGFIHAYAPVLEECDIDQKSWFEFLDGFGRSIKYSKDFHGVNAAVAGVARGVTIAAPSAMPITRSVAMAMHVSIEFSRRGYVRYESNKYLDVMNEKFFKPRGLYAMVITFKPYSSKTTEDVDWVQKINADVATRGEGKAPKFGGTSGKTFQDLDVPESAPLIFPKLDAVPDEEKEKKKKGKEAGSFLLGDYYDRRSRAKFEHQNPDSKLNVMPSPEFASRFSDPNHPSRNGNIVSLVSGGKVPMPTLRERARKRRQMLSGGKRGYVAGEQPGRGSLLGTAKRKVYEDIIYLMVVNMPTEEEMEEAREAIKQVVKQDTEQKQIGFTLISIAHRFAFRQSEVDFS